MIYSLRVWTIQFSSVLLERVVIRGISEPKRLGSKDPTTLVILNEKQSIFQTVSVAEQPLWKMVVATNDYLEFPICT